MGGLAIAAIFGAIAGTMKYTKILPRARLVAALLAGCGLAYTAIASGFTSILGGFSAVVLIVGLVVSVIIAGADLAKDKQADWGALTAAVIAPVLLVAMGGAVGDLGDQIVNGLNSGAEAAVGRLFGG